MNEQLIHALEAAQQLPDAVQSAIAARILQEIEKYQGFGGSETLEEMQECRGRSPLPGRGVSPLTNLPFEPPKAASTSGKGRKPQGPVGDETRA